MVRNNGVRRTYKGVEESEKSITKSLAFIGAESWKFLKASMFSKEKITDCKSDIELAVRATKEMEHILKTYFVVDSAVLVDDYTSGKSLHQLISEARFEDEPFPLSLQGQMRYLTSVRNSLVHDHDNNRFQDRERYVEAFKQVEAELNRMLEKKRVKNEGSDKGCAIM
eukprot:snap_masked-scaffold_13-processed-gene-5.21-mRNA-1 protein AED:1.00 eAED:1.00 QI:0/-1/0/0/-1/1/1/0/167